MTEKEWIMAYRVIHYINQFFAGIGGAPRALLLKPGTTRTRDVLLRKFWTFCSPNGTTDGYILQICWI